MTALNKAEIVRDNARGANDTGSPEVQVALLTAPINELTPGTVDATPKSKSRRSRMIEILYALFDGHAIAIRDHGGEILRFIGDGIPRGVPDRGKS